MRIQSKQIKDVDAKHSEIMGWADKRCLIKQTKIFRLYVIDVKTPKSTLQFRLRDVAQVQCSFELLLPLLLFVVIVGIVGVVAVVIFF